MNLDRLLRYSPIGRHVTPEPAAEEAEPAPDLRTFVVVAYWPDRKVTYSRSFEHALDQIRCAFAAGATHVDLSPEWEWRTAGAA